MALQTQIQHKRSTTGGVTPTTSDLTVGELGVNLVDRRLYTANSSAVFDAVQNVASDFAITGNFSLKIGNSTVNATANSTTITLANSTVSTQLTIPTAAQYSGDYFLHANGDWVEVTGGGSSQQRVYQSFTATGGQTIFTVTGGYSLTFIDVFYNGVHLANTEYTEDGTNVTLSSPANTGAIVEVAGYKNANLVSPTPAGSNTQVQYNGSGTLSANDLFTFAVDTGTLKIGNSTVNTTVTSTAVKLSNSTVNTTLTVPTSAQYSATNFFLHANGNWVEVTAGGGSPGGSNTYVQYNNSGSFGGSAGLVFNSVSNNLTVSNTVLIGANVTLTTTRFTVGNSTVNTFITSTAVETDGTLIVGGNTTLSSNVTFSANGYWGDNVVIRPKFLDYSETLSVQASANGTVNVNCEGGNIHKLTLDGNITTLNFQNWPASGSGGKVTVYFVQGGSGSYTVSWPAAVDWGDAGAPTLQTTVGDADIITFTTLDAGTNIFGFHNGGGFIP